MLSPRLAASTSMASPRAATEAWRAKLSPIAVSTGGVNKSHITNFYSGVYRTMINPAELYG